MLENMPVMISPTRAERDLKRFCRMHSVRYSFPLPLEELIQRQGATIKPISGLIDNNEVEGLTARNDVPGNNKEFMVVVDSNLYEGSEHLLNDTLAEELAHLFYDKPFLRSIRSINDTVEFYKTVSSLDVERNRANIGALFQTPTELIRKSIGSVYADVIQQEGYAASSVDRVVGEMARQARVSMSLMELRLANVDMLLSAIHASVLFQSPKLISQIEINGLAQKLEGFRNGTEERYESWVQPKLFADWDAPDM